MRWMRKGQSKWKKIQFNLYIQMITIVELLLIAGKKISIYIYIYMYVIFIDNKTKKQNGAKERTFCDVRL